MLFQNGTEKASLFYRLQYISVFKKEYIISSTLLRITTLHPEQQQ